ncbi:FG-GAP-like repeat-containing protein [Solwaraspora sp. WMMB335]|uniref:FG-GAP-like repeat-containing protein n=1 Tax=Solwaraspora sp. WMMB335 TaxID=3404118 RepID=UPI003B936F37
MRWLAVMLALVMMAGLVPGAALAAPTKGLAARSAFGVVDGLPVRVAPAGENDVVLTVDVGTDYDAAALAGVIADINGRNTRLSTTVKQLREEHISAIPATPIDDIVDFHGTLSYANQEFSLLIYGDQPHTNASWWLEALAAAVGLAVTTLLDSLCVAYQPFPYCFAAAGVTGTFVSTFITVAADGQLGTADGWLKILSLTLISAVPGQAAGEKLAEFAESYLWPYLLKIGNFLKKLALTGWSLIRPYLGGAGDLIQWLAPRLPDAIRRGHNLGVRSARVMPVGDSITLGIGSPTLSSYRMSLQQLLHERGIPSDFVGSQVNGVRPPGSPVEVDPYHEGHSGWRIDEIAARLPDWLVTYRPTVVTLHLGTNDMIQNYQVGTAVDRLGQVVDQIFAGLPRATVVVASLVPSRTPAIDARIRTFNDGLRNLVQTRAAGGEHLVYVDMGAVTKADIADDVHPNDAGYLKMAKIFSLGIQSAAFDDWLADPSPVTPATCSGDPNPGGPPSGPRQVQFADLNGDDRADYLAVDPRTGSVRTWLNIGADRDGDQWKACGITASGTNTGVGLNGRQVQFADIDGDFRDDYLAVDPATGSVRAWSNVRGYQSGDHWLDRGIIASGTNTGVGLNGRQVQFADIDGDFRDDYLAVDPSTGSVWAWLNEGAENGGDRWAGRGIIASGANTGVGPQGREVLFADLNGDGLDDYLSVENDDGSVRGWLNEFAFLGGDRWRDRGVIASGTNTGVGTLGREVRLADLNGDGRDDYLALDRSNGLVHGWVNVRADDPGDNWLYRGVIASGTNTGVGLDDGVPPTGPSGPRQTMFGDLNGDGRDDYLAVDPATGSVRAWLNINAESGGNRWSDQGIIASGTNTGVGNGANGTPGREVRFADLNGDGRDDYLAVDPTNGLVHAWINDGAENGGDRWLDRGIIASGTNTGVGLGSTGRQVRFADLDGDGRDDYLAVDPRNGSVRGWINVGADRAGDRWVDRGIIASGTGTGVSAGETGRRVVLADLNGDGLDDYLVLDPTNGHLRAWLNNGAHVSGDHWLDRGTVASGTGTGVAIVGKRAQLATVDPDRRADYLAVDPADGSVRAWLNNGAESGGDRWIDRGMIVSGSGDSPTDPNVGSD